MTGRFTLRAELADLWVAKNGDYPVFGSFGLAVPSGPPADSWTTSTLRTSTTPGTRSRSLDLVIRYSDCAAAPRLAF
jgi:hypothetical protein